jgi:dienelactone hydrolase
MTVTISGLPARALADEPFTVRVSGLEPDAAVSLDCRVENFMGGTWRSIFTARSDTSGMLDLATIPLDGFDEPDSTALLWALDPPEKPEFGATADDVQGHLSVRQGSETLARYEFARVFADEGVTCQELEPPLAGALYLPPGGGVHPGVMTVSGSNGGIARGQAALYASRGYACLALAYFNYPGRPAALQDIPLEYFGGALEWLAGHPRVREDAIAVTGGSRGGELSLLLGATFPRVRAVIAVVPSGYIWGGIGSDTLDVEAWTRDGVPLERVPASDTLTAQNIAVIDGAQHYTPAFRAAIEAASPDQLAAAEIPVENTNGPILMLAGADDAMWDATALSQVVLQRTKAAGFPHQVELVSYPAAGHALVTPYTPVITEIVHPLVPLLMAFGGTRAGTARARVAAWQRTLDFLEATFGPP